LKENILVDKSFTFAVRIVKLYKYLCNDKKEFVLSKQLLRSGTSIGANINESQDAQSKNDFISKLSISLKEARETKYWIELLEKQTIYLQMKQIVY
jgi:four helix bundle protein